MVLSSSGLRFINIQLTLFNLDILLLAGLKKLFVSKCLLKIIQNDSQTMTLAIVSLTIAKFDQVPVN